MSARGLDGRRKSSVWSATHIRWVNGSMSTGAQHIVCWSECAHYGLAICLLALMTARERD